MSTRKNSTIPQNEWDIIVPLETRKKVQEELKKLGINTAVGPTQARALSKLYKDGDEAYESVFQLLRDDGIYCSINAKLQVTFFDARPGRPQAATHVDPNDDGAATDGSERRIVQHLSIANMELREENAKLQKEVRKQKSTTTAKEPPTVAPQLNENGAESFDTSGMGSAQSTELFEPETQQQQMINANALQYALSSQRMSKFQQVHGRNPNVSTHIKKPNLAAVLAAIKPKYMFADRPHPTGKIPKANHMDLKKWDPFLGRK